MLPILIFLKVNIRNVFISSGHSNISGTDRGATGIDGIVEGDLVVELKDLIVKELQLLNQIVFTDHNSYVTNDTVKIINKLLKPHDVAIDLHFNAFAVESAKGTEVLVPFKASKFELDLAKCLCDQISACLNTKNRGIKTEANSARKHLIFMTPNCENILIEVCFITNKTDLIMYLTKKQMVAKVIAKCIFDFLTK